jgi:hypothetical protein
MKDVSKALILNYPLSQKSIGGRSVPIGNVKGGFSYFLKEGWKKF